MDYPFNLVTEYVIKGHHIDTTKKYKICEIPARNLICPERIDLMAKWIYIDAYEKKMKMKDAVSLYMAHLDAFSYGSFIEPGKEWKNSLQIYIETFNSLIEDIKENGFDKRKSLIPVGANNVILDGSHRVAIAAYFDKTVSIICFSDCAVDFNTKFFGNNLLERKYLDQMVSRYVDIMSDCYMACLWPVAYDINKLKQAEDIISESGKIVYTKDVTLTHNGMRNFMVQIYGHQSWVGTYENHYSGVEGKVTACYNDKKPVRTIMFMADGLDQVLKIKRQIREIYCLENHSVHISDNINETRQMARLLYNDNSIHHLNYGVPDFYLSVNARIEEFKKLVLENGLNLERFVIDSGSVLEIYGLRESRDLDYLTDYITTNLPQTEECDNHLSEMPYYNCTICDLIYNPDNYFIYNNIKFVSLPRLISMKETRAETKDKKDVKLMKRSLNNNKRRELICEEKILKYQRTNGIYGRGKISKKAYIKHRIKSVLKKFKSCFSKE